MSAPPARSRRPFALRNRWAASRRFQSFCAALWPLRTRARAEGEALFDLVAGFVHTQVLRALVEMQVLRRLNQSQQSLEDIAAGLDLAPERARVLLNAGVALGLLEMRTGLYRTSMRGAAIQGVPGLEAMIGHDAILYRDLADPVAFFRGETETELADFWPYVFGAGAAEDPDRAHRYSDLMADTQGLVAEETLRYVNLHDVDRLMDIGGGSGAFLSRVAKAYPQAELALFDLPAVIPAAEARLGAAGLLHRVEMHPGSFRTDPLPRGADAISLVRVLFDHADDTVAALLAAVFAALPPGGRLIVSEPMSGGTRPQRAGDVYFAIYCMAMRTGRVRSAVEIGDMAEVAGFDSIEIPPVHRPFITSVVLARKPGSRPESDPDTSVTV